MAQLDRRTAALGIGLAGMMPMLPACSAGIAKSAARRPRADLYNCEGCEGIYERVAGGAQAVIADRAEPGERMRIDGRVLAADGVTPAAGVLVYAYHTNAAGLYANGTRDTEWSRRHGRLRGWVRTAADGSYRFDTIKPAPYPKETMPAHVHLTIGEAGRRPYYIDDIVFAGEFGVTPDYIRRQELRGGSGIARLHRDPGGLLRIRRDIVLEPHPA